MQWWRTRLNTHKLMPSGGQAWIPIRARIPASDHCTLPGSSSVWREILASSAGSCTCPDTLPDVWTTKLSQGWHSLSCISSEPTSPGLCRNSGAPCGTQASISTISPVLGQGPVHRGKVCFVWQVITGRIPAALKERLLRAPLVRQVHDLPNYPSWQGHLMDGLPQEAFVLCPMWPGGWRGQRSVCFQGVRGLVSTSDLQ